MDWSYECVPINLTTSELLTDFDGRKLEITLEELEVFLDTVNADHVINGGGPIIGVLVLPIIKN